MRSLCAAFLNGRGLQDVDPALLLTEVRHSPAETVYADIRLPGGAALTVKRTVHPARVRLCFEVHEEDGARRRAILDRAAAWAAGGGTLTVSDRPGQALRVRCARLPEVSAAHWCERMTFEFEGFPLPWWQDERPQTVQLDGRSGTAEVFVPGCAGEAPVSVTLRAKGPLGSLQLTAGESAIRLEGLALKAGGELELGIRPETGLFFIRRAETGASLLGCRTADSSDLLLLPAGRRSRLSLTADAEAEAEFQVRGVYP